jgi:hypothetical protein
MCNDWMTAFWCFVDRSDRLEEQRIALEAILFRTGSSSERPRYCLYNSTKGTDKLVQILIGHANLPYLD